MTSLSSDNAIILFAHGSRDPLWHKPMEAVAAHIVSLAPQTAVACAYLELSKPDLPTAVQTLVSAGARHISILPMFLGVGRHAREDLPMLLHQLCDAFPSTAFSLKAAVGEEPRLVALLAQLAIESL
jgi:sirohydrochlorin cobaltochelatase